MLAIIRSILLKYIAFVKYKQNLKEIHCMDRQNSISKSSAHKLSVGSGIGSVTFCAEITTLPNKPSSGICKVEVEGADIFNIYSTLFNIL